MSIQCHRCHEHYENEGTPYDYNGAVRFHYDNSEEQASRDGWYVSDDVTICDECRDELEEKEFPVEIWDEASEREFDAEMITEYV